ncbi:MAG: hypothetical protein ACRDGA_06285, partial [Bacteroidota bacterium]
TQDEYTAGIRLASVLGEMWALRGQTVSNVLADNRLIDLSRLAQHQALAGAAYHRPGGISFALLGGYEYNAQGDEQDGGVAYMAEASGSNIQVENFQTNFQARSSQSFLSPRRQRDDSLVVSLDRDFGEGAQNFFSVKYNNQRREFYIAADSAVRNRFDLLSNVFRREAQVLDISNRLQYRPSERTRLTFDGGISNRTIERGVRHKDLSPSSNAVLDTRVNELQLYGSLELAYRMFQAVDGRVEIAYREREERHEVIETDAPLALVQRQEGTARRLGNVSRQTMVRSQQKIDISLRDQLNIVGSASILRYDTPDTLNTDDRDELQLSFGIEAIHTAGRYLRVSLAADAVLGHLVYLHRQQSANNNWNRIIRFSPKVEYTPAAWLRTVNTAEVLANYTVYDFEDQVAFVRSFSFRQASWSDSTILRLTPHLDLSLVGTVRVYERGILEWKEFKERPQNYFVEKSLWPQLSVSVGNRFRVGLGYRYFAQDRYRYFAGVRELERRLETGGPTALLEWEQPGFHRLSIQGWREQQLEDGATIRTISNLSLKTSIAL